MNTTRRMLNMVNPRTSQADSFLDDEPADKLDSFSREYASETSAPTKVVLRFSLGEGFAAFCPEVEARHTGGAMLWFKTAQKLTAAYSEHFKETYDLRVKAYMVPGCPSDFYRVAEEYMGRYVAGVVYYPNGQIYIPETGEMLNGMVYDRQTGYMKVPGKMTAEAFGFWAGLLPEFAAEYGRGVSLGPIMYLEETDQTAAHVTFI